MADEDIRHLGIKTTVAVCPFDLLVLNPENRFDWLDPKVIPEWFGAEIGNRVLALS
jgi:hypothetical protein